MSLFSYSAAISNLVGNTAGANVSNLVAVLNDLKTFLNGANIDDTNLATKNKATTLKGPYETIHEHSTVTGGLTAANGVYLPYVGANGDGLSPSAGGVAFSAPSMFQLTAADHASSGMTTNLRMRVQLSVNGTAPTGNWTMGLYPLTAVAGGATVMTFSVGTVVSGSTVTQNTPTANTHFPLVTSDFSFPTDGLYAFGVSTTANSAANTLVAITFTLQRHHV